MSSKPHRITKARVVFDPSDNYIPKKKKKLVKQTTMIEQKKKQNIKPSKQIVEIEQKNQNIKPSKQIVEIEQENQSIKPSKQIVEIELEENQDIKEEEDQDIKQEEDLDIKQEEDLDIKEEEDQDIKEEEDLDIKEEEDQDVKEEVDQDIKQEEDLDIKQEEDLDIKQEEDQYITPSIRSITDTVINSSLMNVWVPNVRLSSSSSAANNTSNLDQGEYLHSNICTYCPSHKLIKPFIECSICKIGVHQDCVLNNETEYKFKISDSLWLCKQCRIKFCIKCLKDRNSSQFGTFHTCITCYVGYHFNCNEEYNEKPLQKLHHDVHLCTPCISLATEKLSNLDDASSLASFSSEHYDEEGNFLGHLRNSHDSTPQDPNVNLPPIPPETIHWTEYELAEYLTSRGLSRLIYDKIVEEKIDGKCLKLLQRSDILGNMGLLLGNALSLYREIRILQTRSYSCLNYWAH